MAVEITQLVATATISAIGALLAAAVGYRYAVARVRHERTFDKQLLWYERATTTLLDAANKLNWALAGDLAKIPATDQARAWAEAHAALVGLRGLDAEAEMYASRASQEAISEAIQDVVDLARTVWVLPRLPETGSTVVPKRLYEICFKLLYHAASRTATEVRLQLGLPPLEREWRLYDQDLRELREELEVFKQQGKDFSTDAWAAVPPAATAAR